MPDCSEEVTALTPVKDMRNCSLFRRKWTHATSGPQSELNPGKGCCATLPDSAAFSVTKTHRRYNSYFCSRLRRKWSSPRYDDKSTAGDGSVSQGQFTRRITVWRSLCVFKQKCKAADKQLDLFRLFFYTFNLCKHIRHFCVRLRSVCLWEEHIACILVHEPALYRSEIVAAHDLQRSGVVGLWFICSIWWQAIDISTLYCHRKET